MMSNKIILLTIFLYITLNLRKIENFIQSGYKIEYFTAEIDKERVALVSLETRMQIALVKLVGLSMFIYFQAPKKEWWKFNEWIDVVITTILLLSCVIIAALYYSGILDLQSMTTLDNLINESFTLIFIRTVIRSTLAPPEGVMAKALEISNFLSANNPTKVEGAAAPPVRPNDQADMMESRGPRK